VASGASLRVQELLDRLIAIAGIGVDVPRRKDTSDPVEAMVTRADTIKLRRETGWTPRISLDQTLADTLEYWMNRQRTTHHAPRAN
jgi:GDP-4-dehydro-6-deoxy-D-mannose reductase